LSGEPNLGRVWGACGNKKKKTRPIAVTEAQGSNVNKIIDRPKKVVL